MLLWLDGQGHYTTAEIPAKYHGWSSGGIDHPGVTYGACTWSVVPGGGRTSIGNSLRRAATGSGSVNLYGYVQPQTTTTRQGPRTPTTSGVIGFAIKINDLATINLTQDGIQWSPAGLVTIIGGSGGYDWSMKLVPHPDGSLAMWRSTNIATPDIFAQTAPGVLVNNTWAYLEFLWDVSQALTGRAVVRVNGATLIDFTGRTSGLIAPDEWTEVRLLGMPSVDTPQPPPTLPPTPPNPSLTIDICDLYLADLTAQLPDDVHGFLGDGTVETFLPRGAGAASEWLSNIGGASNWQAVDDPVPDGDITYIGGAVDATDTYAFGGIAGTRAIAGLQVSVLARVESVDFPAVIAPMMRLEPSLTNFPMPADPVTTEAWDRYVVRAAEVSPATNVRFTRAELASAQFGVRRTG